MLRICYVTSLSRYVTLLELILPTGMQREGFIASKPDFEPVYLFQKPVVLQAQILDQGVAWGHAYFFHRSHGTVRHSLTSPSDPLSHSIRQRLLKAIDSSLIETRGFYHPFGKASNRRVALRQGYLYGGDTELMPSSHNRCSCASSATTEPSSILMAARSPGVPCPPGRCSPPRWPRVRPTMARGLST